MKQSTPERSTAMFRRIRYKKWMVGGLALAALASPATAQAMSIFDVGGSTSVALRYNMSPAAYKALIAKSEGLNARFSSVRYGPPDGWYPHMVTLTRPALKGAAFAHGGGGGFASAATAQPNTVVDGRSPDTRDAAQAAQAPSRTPYGEGGRAAQATLLTPIDGRSPDTRDAAFLAHAPVVTVYQASGFKWGDFAIGIGVALGGLLLLALGLRILSNRQGRKPTPIATA
jgi:hypothetical protein